MAPKREVVLVPDAPSGTEEENVRLLMNILTGGDPQAYYRKLLEKQHAARQKTVVE